jgi:hypothetical protein
VGFTAKKLSNFYSFSGSWAQYAAHEFAHLPPPCRRGYATKAEVNLLNWSIFSFEFKFLIAPVHPASFHVLIVGHSTGFFVSYVHLWNSLFGNDKRINQELIILPLWLSKNANWDVQ